MQCLPLELQLHINHHLPIISLSKLSRCSHYYHEISVPMLYRELTIKIQVLGADISAHKKIRTYIEGSLKLCEHLQSLTVCGETISPSVFRLALRPICLLLGVILQARFSKGLQVFIWRLDCPCEIDLMRYLPSRIAVLDVDAHLFDCSRHVRNIPDLRCHRISSVKQAKCIGQHAESARGLRRLFLSLESPGLTRQSQIILESLRRLTDSPLRARSLHYVGLDNMDISDWPVMEIPSLRHLSLQQCQGTDKALVQYTESNRHCINLKRLDVTLSQPSPYLFSALAKLQDMTCLTSLQLLLGGESSKVSLECALLSQRSIRHLIVESRIDASDPTTVHPYKVYECLRITSSCRSLQTLGIPIDISKDSWKILVRYSLNQALSSTDSYD